MKKTIILVVAIVLILSCGVSFATVITFDDLPPAGPEGALVPEGYAGFVWTNFGYADPLQTQYKPSGYVNGTVSPTNIAYNNFGDPSMLSNGSFEFVGAYFTGAWNDGLNVTVDGYLNGELVDSTTIVTSYYSPTWTSFNWVVDQLDFSSSGGIPVTPPGNTQFVMDDFTYVQGGSSAPPVADAGDDIVAYTGLDGTATVKLDGSGSYDPDGNNLEYFWFEDANQIATGVDPNVVLAAGVHVIDLVVDDGEFSSEPNSIIVNVVPAVETEVRVYPRVLNTTSRGRYVIARMQLPDGVSADDMESDSLTLTIGDVTIESVRQRAVTSMDRHYVFGFFDRGEVAAQGEGKPKLDIVIAGQLVTGQCIYGEDTIKIVKSNGPKKPLPNRKPVRNGRGSRVSR